MPLSQHKTISSKTGFNPSLLLAAILMLVIFYLDSMIPLGVAFGVSYLIVILVVLLTSNRQVVITFSIICTLLTLAGLLFSPTEGEVWKVYVNRTIAIFAIWVTAAIGLLGKRTLEKLRESEARSSNAQRIAHLGFWDFNIIENKLYWSDEIYQIFGLGINEFEATYEAFLNSVHPDDREHVEKSVNAAMENDTIYSIDHRIVLPDGEVRYVHEQGEVSRDNAGRTIGMFGTVMDITERKQIEERLRTEKEKTQNYLDVAGSMLVAINDKGEITLLNKKGCEVLGYGEHEIIGKNWFDNFLPERLRVEVKGVFNTLMKGEIKQVEFYENPVLLRNGKEKVIAWHNTLLRDSEGRIVGTLGSGTDITERKQSEKIIR
jgi:PAS domain S-box-containing protein